MERIVIINESIFVKWTKSVERLQGLLRSQEQQDSVLISKFRIREIGHFNKREKEKALHIMVSV